MGFILYQSRNTIFIKTMWPKIGERFWGLIGKEINHWLNIVKSRFPNLIISRVLI